MARPVVVARLLFAVLLAAGATLSLGDDPGALPAGRRALRAAKKKPPPPRAKNPPPPHPPPPHPRGKKIGGGWSGAASLPSSDDTYRPTGYPATWDWRACKAASANPAGCYTAAVSGAPNATTYWPANSTANFVSAVSNQGACVSDWAFAAAGVVESAWAIQGGCAPGTKLSAQAYVDCFFGTTARPFSGCQGGDRPIYAMLGVQSMGALPLDTKYPYTTTTNNCNGAALKGSGILKGKILSATDVDLNSTDSIFLALKTKGPLAITIYGTGNNALLAYTAGIYTTPNGVTDVEDAAVVLVGWGEETVSGVTYPYWIVKNAWSATWGEQGYFRMARKRWTANAYTVGGKACAWRGIYSAAYVVAVK